MDTWAIGDIHGCFNKLSALLTQIPKTNNIVFLGDYIDRGSQIQGVVNFLLSEIDNPKYTFLIGNHEELFLDYLSKGGTHWLVHGGDRTLAQLSTTTSEKFARVCETMKDRHETSVNYFVHGGMSPGIPFADQDRNILLLYRPPDHEDYDHGKFLVHGHTPSRVHDERKHRVNIDTGACYGPTRNLTAVRLCNETGKPNAYCHA